MLLQILVTIVVLALLSSIWWWIKGRIYKIGKKKVDAWLADYAQNIESLKSSIEKADHSDERRKAIKNIFYYERPFTKIMLDNTNQSMASCLDPDNEFIRTLEKMTEILHRNDESIRLLKSLLADDKYSESLQNLDKSLAEYKTDLEHYTSLRKYSLDFQNIQKRKEENKKFSRWTDLRFERAVYDKICSDLDATIWRIEDTISRLADLI